MSDTPAHYEGHRTRLRRRFLERGADALADYELLELLLFPGNPRGDVKPLAKSLLQEFGSLEGVLTAPVDRLRRVKGIGEVTLVALKAIPAAAIRLGREQVLNRPVIAGWQPLLDYCRMTMGYESVEQFRILFLDRRNILIADEAQQRGTVDRTNVYPREVVRRALDLAASAIIMVHNHPSGDTTPSEDDIKVTNQVVEAIAAINVTLHDHVIISRTEHTSFKAVGLL